MAQLNLCRCSFSIPATCLHRPHGLANGESTGDAEVPALPIRKCFWTISLSTTLAVTEGQASWTDRVFTQFVSRTLRLALTNQLSYIFLGFLIPYLSYCIISL
jgi:hypothetical protein